MNLEILAIGLVSRQQFFLDFWSITAYERGSFDLMENPAQRYKISPEMPSLIYNEDGSLTVTLSRNKPEDKVAAANWLPVGEGDFYLHVRFYAPIQSVVSMEYQLPNVVKIDRGK